MATINVTSEIGQLKKVMLHRPGEELLLLTPDTLGELLFDDIPFLKNAQIEHDMFAKVLKNQGVQVLYLEDLMAETIASSDQIRQTFIEQFIAESGLSNRYYKDKITEFLLSIDDPKKLVLETMEGVCVYELENLKTNSLENMLLDDDDLLINPMPNLYFTRDPFACVGNGVSIHKMFSVTRSRETIYGDFIFKYHPEYAGKVPLYYERSGVNSIEGGDILNISKHTIAIGISQRTTAGAIDSFVQNVFFKNESEIKTVLAFDIPKKRAFMHLDTVFTQIDYDKFTVHPAILGPLRLYEITPGASKGEIKIREINSTLEKVLEKCTGASQVDLIRCAGGNPIASEREQWNDGSNTLCVSPGTVIVYERNDVTNEILTEHGIKVLEIPSGELSRGRGGPRCMSMPFYRDEI